MPKKNPTRAERLATALDEIEERLALIQELQDEIENWQSNLEGTNLENTAKYEQLGECAEALDQVRSTIEDAIEEGRGIEFPSAR